MPPPPPPKSKNIFDPTFDVGSLPAVPDFVLQVFKSKSNNTCFHVCYMIFICDRYCLFSGSGHHHEPAAAGNHRLGEDQPHVVIRGHSKQTGTLVYEPI
jgi:hypothetical protein